MPIVIWILCPLRQKFGFKSSEQQLCFPYIQGSSAKPCKSYSDIMKHTLLWLQQVKIVTCQKSKGVVLRSSIKYSSYNPKWSPGIQGLNLSIETHIFFSIERQHVPVMSLLESRDLPLSRQKLWIYLAPKQPTYWTDICSKFQYASRTSFPIPGE